MLTCRYFQLDRISMLRPQYRLIRLTRYIKLTAIDLLLVNVRRSLQEVGEPDLKRPMTSG